MAVEKVILNKLQLAATAAGHRLFRNNVGLGWVGKILARQPDMLTLGNPRPLHAGLCKGSSDLIGWTMVEITPDMVGMSLPVFTAVEAKTPGVTVTTEQEAFLNTVRRKGGIAAVVRDEVDYERAVK